MINPLNTLYIAALNGTKSLELSKEHIKFWEQARAYVVGGDALGASDLVSKTVDPAVRLIFFVGIIGITVTLLYQTGFKNGKGGAMPVFSAVAPQAFFVILVLFLTNNQYEKAYDIANSTWALRNNMRNNTQSVVQANQVFTEAISNELFNAQFGQEVTAQLETCQKLPAPLVRVPTAVRTVGAEGIKLETGQTYDFLECLNTLEATIQENQAILKRQCGQNLGSCELAQQKASDLGKQVAEGTQKIKSRLIVGFGTGPATELTGIGRLPDPLLITGDFSAIGDVIAGALSSVGDFIYMELVELGNTLYTSSIEVLFLLSGLFFPITIVWSLIPGKKQVLLDWLVATLALIVTEQIYLILVGTVATLSALPQFHAFGPRLFLITLGILAPLLAVASGGVTGFAMARTYRGAAAGAASAALSVAAGAAFSIAYKANSRKQLQR